LRLFPIDLSVFFRRPDLNRIADCLFGLRAPGTTPAHSFAGRAGPGFAAACAVVVTLGLSGLVQAQSTGAPPAKQSSAPKAPVAANAPAAAVPAAPQVRPDGGPMPIRPDAPRVAPVPTGQSAGEDYKIGPQDLIEIQVFGIDNLKREVRVNSRGVISLPLVGPVTVAGLSNQEAEALIAAKYEKDYLQDPQVSVFIKEFTSQRITVEGAVNHPGIFPIRGPTSLLQAIAIAGGQGQLSDMKDVKVYRVEGGQKKALSFDVLRIRSGELEDPLLSNDDVVVIQRSADRVAVRDSFFGDLIGILNPFNYLPK
jgi:polysaccharide export outer membrane protein